MRPGEFRVLVAVTATLAVAAPILSLWEQQFLPPALQQFEARQTAAAQRADATVLLLLIGCVLVAALLFLISLAGMWKWKAWGRKLFAWSLALTIPVYLITGATVQTALSGATQYAAAVCEGLLLGLAYFSPLSERFERKPDEFVPV